MHATSGATVAAGVGLLRDLKKGSGRASIWITLEGLSFEEASAPLFFPSSATGAKGFHMWCGGVAGGVRAVAETKSNSLKSIGHFVKQGSNSLVIMYIL